MENSSNDLVILLTGSITPNSFSNLILTDPEIREQQYREALNFYIEKTNYKIIFAENSGASLENFPKKPERIEYLSFKTQPNEPERGKAFKEIEIIDFVFQNSIFLRKSISIVKVTGRLKVLNIRKLSYKFLKLIKKNSGLIYCYPYRSNNMDARCFFFTKDFWPFLKYEAQNLNLKYNLEMCLWDTVNKYQTDPGKEYLPINPPLRVKGLSGAFGKKYRHNLIFHYARYIRQLIQQ